MRKIFSLVGVALLLFSCTPKDRFVINGSVEGADLNGRSIYLVLHDQIDVLRSDTAQIEKDRFTFEGKLDEPAVYYLYMEDDGLYNGEIVQGIPLLLGHEKVGVRIVKDRIRIDGNAENKAWQKVLDKQYDAMDAIREMAAGYQDYFEEGTLTPEMEAEMEEKADTIYNGYREMLTAYLLENIGTSLAQEVFVNNWNFLENEDLERILADAPQEFTSRDEIRELIATIESYARIAVGNRYVDFSLPAPDGKIVAISDYLKSGKHLLIDFWASWCAPCIREMPELVLLYEKYGKKNFEIVGVSLDEERESWLTAVKEHKMRWPQVSDLHGCPAATQPYMVSVIPHTVLISPDGIIVAKDLRGKELEAKLQEVINN